ncbi:Putative protein [Zobellia galactanivorans]|uniref:Uncharacterized protein n=1 Tax=Zobellia galactanivorans (strain DSM 12802 / CCUG 47099 / CIP 106680 / NCIMB 13871 / Dsij) TaxID=63186 RepID=G0L5S3_ZOBGA|nr:Putative protein [Zobellia galactanivorans]
MFELSKRSGNVYEAYKVRDIDKHWSTLVIETLHRRKLAGPERLTFAYLHPHFNFTGCVLHSAKLLKTTTPQ